MLFRPRIFVSSTLDLKDIREKIRSHFETLGAEPLLYEIDLTPSARPFTYRQDILQSDFVILILDSRYGSLTGSGLSGTHEEWKIAAANRIPIHAYVRDAGHSSTSRDPALQKFIDDELKQRGISYFIFNDESDLLDRIRRTTFQIAHEISTRHIADGTIPFDLLRKASARADYDKALVIVRGFEEITTSCSHVAFFDLIDSTVVNEYFQPWYYEDQARHGLFIDGKSNDLWNRLKEAWLVFVENHANNYSSAENRDVRLESTRMTLNVSRVTASPFAKISEIQEQLHKLLRSYESFKRYVLDRNAYSEMNW